MNYDGMTREELGNTLFAFKKLASGDWHIPPAMTEFYEQGVKECTNRMLQIDEQRRDLPEDR